MRGMASVATLLACVCGLMPATALSQSAASLVPPPIERVQSQLNALDAPNGGNSPATTYQSKVSIETSTDKSTASLDVGGVITSHAADFFTAALTAKAPFDSSKSDVLDLGNLSGLTAGTQAHLALGWSRWPLMSLGAISDVLSFQNSAYLVQLYGGYPWDRPALPGAPTLRDAVVTLKLDPSPRTLITDEATYKKVIAELNKEIDAFNAKNAASAGFRKLAEVTALGNYSKIADAAQQAYFGIAQTYAPKWVPSLALTLDGNQQSFTYVQTSARRPTGSIAQVLEERTSRRRKTFNEALDALQLLTVTDVCKLLRISKPTLFGDSDVQETFQTQRL
jgi:hypothetical protein